MKYELGFIGCGNMGGALVTAAAKSVDGNKIAVCDFDTEKVKKLQTSCGVVPSTAKEIAAEAKFVVLAVKPQAMQAAISEFADELRARKDVTVITMAAGLSIAAIRSYVGADLPVIRIMPNTPVLVGAGMILYALADVDEETETRFLNDFSHAGKFDKLPEEGIDAGSALSGCGPAFVYAFAQALADGGEKCGVPADKAALYTAQTLLGAAEMLLAHGDPEVLKRAVCSPNGTTIEGVKHLENTGFHETARGAVLAAYKRTLELKK